MSWPNSRERGYVSLPGDVEDDSGDGTDSSHPLGLGEPAICDIKLLACPYYKHDPKKYQSVKPCMGPGWTSISRLKEHLYRKHRLPIHCPRCYKIFSKLPERDGHMRLDPPCWKEDSRKAPEGFDKLQEKEIRSRKVTVNSGMEADKWRSIYKILFPDDHASQYPSPYYDYRPSPETGGVAEGPSSSGDLARFMSTVRSQHSQRQLRSQILQILHRQGAGSEPSQLASELTDLFISSQMDALKTIQGHGSGIDLADYSSLELDSQAIYQPRTTRRSSASSITFRGHNRAAGLDSSGHDNLSALSTPESHQRASTSLGSDSSGMMETSLAFDPFYQDSIDVPMQDPSFPMWPDTMDLSLLSYSEGSMAMQQYASYAATGVGTQFAIPTQPNPATLDLASPDGQVDLPLPQQVYFPVPPHMEECNEHQSHGAAVSMASMPRSRTN